MEEEEVVEEEVVRPTAKQSHRKNKLTLETSASTASTSPDAASLAAEAAAAVSRSVRVSECGNRGKKDEM